MDVTGVFTVGAAVGVTAGVTVGALAVAGARRRQTGPHQPAEPRSSAAESRPGAEPRSAAAEPGPVTAAPPAAESGPTTRGGDPSDPAASRDQASTQVSEPDPGGTPPAHASAAHPAGPAPNPPATNPPAAVPLAEVDPAPVSPAPDAADGLARLGLGVLRVGVLMLSTDDAVVFANPSAGQLGLIQDVDGRPTVAHSVLRSLAARVRRSGHARDVELELPRAGREPLGVRVRVVALGDDHVAIEVEDMTEAHRVARVRRDFVANVSHELKTPVGALQLLSEALLDATDDIRGDEVAAIRRFTERIQHESTRLGRLVAELLELSRLQGGEPLPEPELVAVDRIVNEVLDRSRTTASAKEITIHVAGQRGLKLLGHERLLVTAVANLVDNAIAYSPENTTVTITAVRAGDDVEISVTDEGIGIAVKDQGRIFERFYRADPARSRATGGTGLGLAIVKHIATNHGGQVSVQSVFGHGSTFTLRLPASKPDGAGAPHRHGELSGTARNTRPRNAAASGTTPDAAGSSATSQGPAGPAITDVRT